MTGASQPSRIDDDRSAAISAGLYVPFAEALFVSLCYAHSVINFGDLVEAFGRSDTVVVAKPVARRAAVAPALTPPSVDYDAWVTCIGASNQALLARLQRLLRTELSNPNIHSRHERFLRLQPYMGVVSVGLSRSGPGGGRASLVDAMAGSVTDHVRTARRELLALARRRPGELERYSRDQQQRIPARLLPNPNWVVAAEPIDSGDERDLSQLVKDTREHWKGYDEFESSWYTRPLADLASERFMRTLSGRGIFEASENLQARSGATFEPAGPQIAPEMPSSCLLYTSPSPRDS